MSLVKKSRYKTRPDGKKATGRPTLYRPEYCEMLIKHGDEGKSFESFGGVIKVSKEALNLWTKEHPEFMRARKIARVCAQNRLESIGLGLMKGEYGRDAQATPWIFTMRNIAGWRDQPIVEDDAVTGVDFLDE